MSNGSERLQALARAPALACSACLLGVRCRYDGASKRAPEALFEHLWLRPARAEIRPAEAMVWRLFSEAGERCSDHRLDFEEIFAALLPRGIVPICPEIFGGLGCPRPPADFSGGDGHALVAQRARLIDRCGRDVSHAFLRGAQLALELVSAHGVQLALLKEGSPSCGVRRVQCDAAKIPGQGVSAALFARAGIRLLSEEDFSARACP